MEPLTSLSGLVALAGDPHVSHASSIACHIDGASGWLKQTRTLHVRSRRLRSAAQSSTGVTKGISEVVVQNRQTDVPPSQTPTWNPSSHRNDRGLPFSLYNILT